MQGRETMTIPCDILVVDDEMSIRGVVASVLSDDGHHVDVAQSGEEALRLFEKKHHPLVISDIVMPGMSGIDLLKKIKEVNAETLVIIMTSHAGLSTSIEALRSGAYDYLIKPFDNINDICIVTNRAVDKIGLLRENKILLDDLKQKNIETSKMNEALRVLAIHDGLTGLYNHRHFHELLDAEIERSKRYMHVFSILFMDVDHFKKFNDTNGHIAGDKVLHTLADLLMKNNRKSSVVARYGGEEFVMLLPEISRADALMFAERIRIHVAEYPFDGRESQPEGIMTVSIGVASFPEDGNDSTTLINHADKSLYRAKESGRNKVC